MSARQDLVGGSTKPYLLRAIYQWALDYKFTPQILVDASADGVVVPAGYVADGRVVFTIHPQAVVDLELGNKEVSFSARFSGKQFDVSIPMTAILAVYCRENGQGMFFRPEQESRDDDAKSVKPIKAVENSSPPANRAAKKTNKPELKLIK